MMEGTGPCGGIKGMIGGGTACIDGKPGSAWPDGWVGGGPSGCIDGKPGFRGFGEAIDGGTVI